MSERIIDVSVEVPGTPEEVWDTIATGPGIGSWFVPMQVDERPGGEVVMDFGTYGKDTATVTVWEPPRRVVFQSGGDRPLAYEWLVESRGGGTCIVRLVNTGFGDGAEWDDEFDGMSNGWRIFLENLRLQLTHFPGRRARAVIPTVTTPGPNAEAWAALCRALGIPTDLRPGDRLETGDGVPPLAGTVEAVLADDMATTYLVLVDDPAPGTAFVAAEGNGESVATSVYLYLYGDDSNAAAGEAWFDWLTSWERALPVERPTPT